MTSAYESAIYNYFNKDEEGLQESVLINMKKSADLGRHKFKQQNYSMSFYANQNQLLKIISYALLFVSITRVGPSIEAILLPSQKTKDPPLLVSFVDSFCGDRNVSYKFRPVSENRLSITFNFKNDSDEDIYMFLLDLLNKLRDKFTRKA